LIIFIERRLMADLRAGKSSIMVALFRMAELSMGAIEIDGIDISKIGLNDLRNGLSSEFPPYPKGQLWYLAVIPQDPLLFSGTLRSNIDPFHTKPDHELYDALKRAHLINDEPARITSGTETPNPSGSGTQTPTSRFNLDTVIEEEGGNLSVGERSLVSLARAMVKNSKIIVLDEATASVDVSTDSKIQETIRREFGSHTLLTIAHRLRTILSYDRILVMGEGKVEEFDTPENLFRANGHFTEMCEKSSITLADVKVGPMGRVSMGGSWLD
jgi:ABC-type multidrug transport system fused ATPase/permease subunit